MWADNLVGLMIYVGELAVCNDFYLGRFLCVVVKLCLGLGASIAQPSRAAAL